MASLVVVESPAKAKTIKKYLGKGFSVIASYGHVRDLIPKEGAVDPNHDFAMKYTLIERNAKHIGAIKAAIKTSDELILATDPDREGEAIAYHIVELLKDAKLLKNKSIKRVAFHEITKSAILEAMDAWRDLSEELIDAQKARRALDYLVGFNLSPLLWRKVRPGLSAGRVQSPALKMICEREIEIEAFKAREYWTINAALTKDKQDFSAKLVEYNGEKLKQFSVTTEKDASKVIKDLKNLSKDGLLVKSIEKKQRKRNPAPPFTTSTLQQEASRKLGFGASRTMRVAQQLYEGIDTGDGAAGLITYMRTDSVNLASSAIDEIREVILDKYGKDFLPDSPRGFKTKSKNAQEAHEAIRPTSALNHPDNLKAFLSQDQYKLYNLIYKRTMACQMSQALIDTVTVDFACGDNNTLRANGSCIAFAGFLIAYEEGLDDKAAKNTQVTAQDKLLPVLKEKELVPVNDIAGTQHFTEPPPRYSEATLVKALEEYGIGRPSTYAAIISTLQAREYVVLENKRFFPTDVGRVVAKFLTNYFNNYVDYDFTAKLEDELDAVSRGEKKYKPLLKQFWQPFIDKIKEINDTVQRKDVTHEELDEKCPTCGKPLSIRLGKRGRFVGCTGYPDCDYTRSMDGAQESSAPEVVEGRKCPECKNDLQIKAGKYGKFIGCSNYPKCKFIEPLEKPEDTEVACPKCNKGNILKRKSRRGKIFYSCQRYPDCDYAIWDAPLDEPCPDCKWPITTIKTTKSKGTQRVCPQKQCKFAEDHEP